MSEIKRLGKALLWNTAFYPTSIGLYIRELYLWKAIGLVPIRSIHDLLDAGCGAGLYAIKLAERYPHLHVKGCDIDISRALKNNASKDKVKVDFFQADLTALTLESEYDFVYCIDVLDDIREYTRALTNLVRALRPGGYLWIHLPLHPRRIHILKSKRIDDYIQADWENSQGRDLNEHILQRQLSSLDIQVIVRGYSYGWYGMLSWELSHIIVDNLSLRLLLTAFLKALARIDVVQEKSVGNGFFVLGQKHITQ